MAGGKETPRQKMIGMMYLVLTALLALNVSKEIINAFVKLDSKLLESQNAFKANGQAAKDKLKAQSLMPGMKAQVAPYIAHAEEISKMSDEMANYIMKCKDDLISAVEGKTWLEKDKDGKQKFKSLMEIQTKDDYDAATRLYGGDPSSDGFKKGEEIRKKLHDYRNKLTSYIAKIQKSGKTTYSFDGSKIKNPKYTTNEPEFLKAIDAALASAYKDDKDAIRQIFMTLTTQDFLKDHDEEHEWQLGMFDHAPVVAGAALFTAIENDIRNAESKALEFVGAKVNSPVFNFNKIEPLAFSRTGYLNTGDSMTLRVMIAAYDSTEMPKIKYDDGSGPKEIIGAIPIQASSPGEKEIKGEIAIKERGEVKWKPWSFRYEVGQPMGVISPIEMNVLYAGYENKVQATASGFPNEKVSLSVPGASQCSKGAQNIYTVKVPASLVGKTIKASVSGAGKQVGTMDFRIRSLPKPSSFLGSIPNTESRINRSQLAAALNSGVRLGYDESIPLKVAFKVTKFEVVVQVGAATKTIQCNGALTPEARTLINQLKAGAALTITGIRGMGPSGEVRGAPLALVIQ